MMTLMRRVDTAAAPTAGGARLLQTVANFTSPSWANTTLNTGTNNTSSSPPITSTRNTMRDGVADYIYIFLAALVAVGIGSIIIYMYHQRRLRRFVEHDNMNNNMQRHSLVDSFIENGEVEWQCTICYHENHPAKRECIMCGTPQVISQQAQASPSSSSSASAMSGSKPPAKNVASFGFSSEEQTLQAARTRSFHVRRLNAMNLNQRQRGAMRRNMWQREKTDDGQFRWVRMQDCRPSRISVLTTAEMPLERSTMSSSSPLASLSSPPSQLLQADEEGDEDMEEVDAYLYEPLVASSQRSRSQRVAAQDRNVGIETELTMHASSDGNGQFSPTIRRLHDGRIDSSTSSFVGATTIASTASGADRADGAENDSDDGGGFISQQSVGYVRHVDANGIVQWVPAETVIHGPHAIDTEEFPRASSVIDFESVAALSFRLKVRWFLLELDKVSIPWEEGHLLLKIRREAVLNESMHLLMLVPASDLRQRLRIEFIEEPGLDAGGLMREWVLLLCEKLFDESYGLFQATHVENLGYWINPNSSQIHRDHLKSFQFIGRLIAKCLLEGQLLTVHFALPLLKHLLGVPISFSDLEFLDQELFKNASWLRNNENVENLCLDFSVQRLDAHGAIITNELKPGGKDIAVTDANKDEYLDLLIKHKMFDSVHEQLSAILQGLYDVIPRTLLAVFDYQELELLLCGVPKIDVDDWLRHTDVKYQDFDHPNKQEKKVVEWFWETVRGFSQEERARLLQFVTGTSRVPVEGFKALLSNDGRVRRFGIQVVACGVPPTGLYPKAHTCFNRIDVPMYKTREDMETYLTLVINMEITGFSMQ